MNIILISSPEYGTLSRLLHRVIVLILRKNLGQAEVSDLHTHFTLHQDVPRGQVPVDVTLRTQIVHPLQNTHTQSVQSEHEEKQLCWILCVCVCVSVRL